jgi:excisionase family DNA binding protein
MLTTQDLRDRFGVSRYTVYSWITSGQLAAIDVSPSGSRHRRYRIRPEDVARFEAARMIGDQRIVVPQTETHIEQFI